MKTFLCHLIETFVALDLIIQLERFLLISQPVNVYLAVFFPQLVLV